MALAPGTGRTFCNLCTAVVVVAVVLAQTSLAFADQIANNLDASVDATAEIMALNAGGSTGTTTLYVVPVNGDGHNGCNFQGSETLGVSVTSSNTSVATVSPASLTFGSCGDTKTLTVIPLAQGTTTISLAQTSNSTGDTFDLTAATFTVNVAAAPPSNTAPSVSVAGVSGGSSYDKGSVPAAGCSVTDAEDGTSTFAATLSAISGPYASDGIGAQTASCSYTDAGGLTASSSATYSIVDPTGPAISYSLTPSAPDGLHGWYTSDVSILWTVSDPDSTPTVDSGCVDQTLTDDTTGTTLGCAAHSAGGSDSRSVTVKIDETGPSAALAVTAGTPGANGWYTSDVTVATSGGDAVSGGVTCTADQFQTAETSGTQFNGSCTNDAGLTTNAAPLTVKLDETGPSAALGVTAGDPGNNGWYTSDVTVSTAGSDPVSAPVTCTADQFQTAETTGQVFNGSCTNDAGLSTDASPLTVKLDRSKPTNVHLEASGTAGANGWFISDVTVSTHGDEDVSTPLVCTADLQQTGETSGQVFNGSCRNDAGLTKDADPLTVRVDETAPTNVALVVTSGTLGQNGWYTSDVTVLTTGDEDVSKPLTCTADQNQTTDTTGTQFNGSCTNDAGLTTDAAPLTVMVDETRPTQAVTGVTDGATYQLGSVPAAGCSDADATSGIATHAALSVSGGGPNGVGIYTATCSGATDNSGNAGTTAKATYTVAYVRDGGIRQPINPDNTSVFKRGNSVPVKFGLSGDPTGGFGTTGWKIQRQSVACSAFDGADTSLESVASTTPSSAFRYDATADQYIYNADFSDKGAGTCWNVKVTLDDNTALYSAVFKLSK